MERFGDIALLLSALDLHDIENTVWEPYHRVGAGRPPRRSLGIFKALVVKRLRQIPSDRELYRRLWDDPALREICDIEDRERPYHPSQLTRFRKRVGPERLEGIVRNLVEQLVEGGVVKGETVAIDYTLIEACNKRDPQDNRRSYSDPDVMMGKDDRSHDLHHMIHIAVDTCSDLQVAYIVALANENEKKHGPTLGPEGQDGSSEGGGEAQEHYRRQPVQQ